MQIDYDVQPSQNALDLLNRVHPANISHINAWNKYRAKRRIKGSVTTLTQLAEFASYLVDNEYNSTGDFLSSIVKHEAVAGRLVQDVHFCRVYASLRRNVATALAHLQPEKAPILSSEGIESLPAHLRAVAVFCVYLGLRVDSVLAIRNCHLKRYANRVEVVVVKDKVRAAVGRKINLFCVCASWPGSCPCHNTPQLPINKQALDLIFTKLACSKHSFRRTLISSVRHETGPARFNLLAPQIRRHFGWSVNSQMHKEYTKDFDLNTGVKFLHVENLCEFFRLQRLGIVR